jgi:predicted dehydrogenase
MAKSNVNRRDFLKTTAAGTTALSLTAASARRVYGANERLGVAFVGVGGRCQAHLDVILRLSKAGKGVAPVAVCDVWDGHEESYTVERGGQKVKRTYSQGLYPSARKVGLNTEDKTHVTKDYRRLLDLKEVDVVCIATPDHWHAKIAIDAAAAGKDVYCEKPMTKTVCEAHAVVDAMKKHNRVMTVGVQSMADPVWRKAHELITAGRIGHVAQAQTSYYRNSLVGQWRYYRLFRDMNPHTIDWRMFLGYDFHVQDGVPLGPKIPFDRAVFGQWRCYWPFGGGMFTDLFVHQTTHLIAALGVRYPRRVVGGGGLYLEYDGRDVPDVATVVADYDEGCQLSITATMICSYPIEEVIRGRLGVIKFVKNGFHVISDEPNKSAGTPARLEKSFELLSPEEKKRYGFDTEFVEARLPEGKLDTEALWENFLECVRSRNRHTLSTPELGAAAFTTVAMGVQSYRQGKVLFWDKEKREAVEADSSWAAKLEERSKDRGKPHQVPGWHAGNTGSFIEPPPWQKLAGPWTGDKDPAGPDAG